MAISTPEINDDVVRQEILRVALRLYRKFGPHKVTMDEVANATGRSRTSLYYYYKSRDEIFQAVLDTIVNDVAEELRHAAAAEHTLTDKLYAFCMAKVRTTQEWKSILNVWSQESHDKAKYSQGKEVDALHKKLIYQESIILNEILSSAISKKEIRAISPAEMDTLSFVISSGIRGLRREVYDINDPHDIKTAVRLLSNMIAGWLAL